MLTEAPRIRTSERIPDPQSLVTRAAPLGLTCQGCGAEVTLPFWQPYLKCPHCQMLGYPDRALRNLLPLGWECPRCKASNSGLTNFCTGCGAGLASRCLRCEAPVYGAVCLQCGEHQARLSRLYRERDQRADWVPIQHERIQEQRRRMQEIEVEAVAAARRSTPVEMDRSERYDRRGRSRRRGWGWRLGWGWIFLAWGLYSVVRQGLGDIQRASAQGTGVNAISSSASGLWAGLQGWWSAFVPSLAQLPTLTPQDPAYAYLFGAALIGLVGLPFGVYMIDRMIKRFFPD